MRKMAFFTSIRSQAQGGRWYFYINQEPGSRWKMVFLNQPGVRLEAEDGIFTPTRNQAQGKRWPFYINQDSASMRKMVFFTSIRSQAQGGRWYFYINQESGSRRKMIFLHQPGVRLKADILGTCRPCVSSILTAEHPSLTLPPFPQKENKVQFLTFNVP